MKAKNFFLLVSVSFLFLGLYFVFDTIKFYDHKLHIVFCDVGQGDAIFVRTPEGMDILIDSGPDASVLRCLSSHMPFLDKDIELAFLSHPHLDHFYGFIEILRYYEIGNFISEGLESQNVLFKALKQSLADHKVRQNIVYKGKQVVVGDGVSFDILWPSKDMVGYISGQIPDASIDKNSLSLVQVLSYKKFKAIFTGDIQADIFNALLTDLTEVDILKVPHHGSKTGMDDSSFLKTKPFYAVISAGKNNKYGHPAPRILALLKANNINYLRTDQSGEVEFVIGKEGIEKIIKHD